MIKVKLQNMLNGMTVFKKIINLNMPAQTAFRVMKLIKEVNEQCATFDNVRKQLLEKYGVSEDGGTTYKILEENNELYTKELNNLLSEEIEILATPFSLDDIEFFNLTPFELLQINDFIVE